MQCERRSARAALIGWMMCLAGCAASVPAPAPVAHSVPAVHASTAPDAGTPARKGSLVIVGGALRPDTAAVWQRIVTLAGGRGARIAIIPAAAGNPMGSGNRIAATLNSYGAAAFVLPLAPRLPGDVHQAANDPALADAVRGATGVYFAGGDQGRITGALRNADGSNSRVLDAVWSVLARGGVVAGSSAGAAIMSSSMFYDTKSVLATLRTGVHEGREIAPGLGFVGTELFVDQHVIVRGRFARMLPAMLAKGYKQGLGIDENSALVVGADGDVEVIGYSGAMLLETAQAVVDPAKPGFNVRNARISYLDSGDHYQLGTGLLTPSADKRDGKLASMLAGTTDAKPDSGSELRGPLRSADILGNSAVVDLMGRLIDSDQTEAVGLAFGAADDTPAGQGFEFRFIRDAASSGYESASSAHYSVYRLRLDVRPIAVGWPTYP